MKLYNRFILLVMLTTPILIQSYNLSPRPNAIIRDPQLASGLPKVESSYFGYSLSLRTMGIIVGAPRAQSTLAAQRNVNETGAIYRCSLTDTTCYPYVFDDKGNRIIEMSEYTYDSERRDNQWLGAAMDGGTSDNDKLVVCAPRFIAPAVNDYLMHGICYWINDTLAKDPTNVRIISPLRLKQDQIKEQNGQRFYYYMLAEQGLSAHISDDNEEILIGAPGIHTWKGSVIRYRKKIITVDPSLSRRDTGSVRVTRQSEELPQAYYESEVPNPEKWGQLNDSYFGYAVTSGQFDSNDRSKISYVATAPQANEQSGEAYVFDISGSSINKHFVFRGKQFGEYFGYSVLAEDLNNDGLTDVIISAPQHSISGSFDDGAIYVFINQGRFNFDRKLITSPFHGKARFGTTLSRLGDINHDGYYDIAVGAPFANNGSVFIYLGSKDGIRAQPSQQLNSPPTIQAPYGGSQMYGHGLSRGSDIDNNGFNDLAVGAPNAEAVFLYRAYPVVKILATINSPTREIKPDQPSFEINVCFGISTTSKKVVNQDLALRIVVDPQVKRVKITQAQFNELNFNVTAGLKTQCRVLHCEVRFSVADIFKPIELEMHYELINSIPDSDVFCDTCAAVDPIEPKIYSEKIIFSTGCASDICIADLHVQSSGLDTSFILGSSRTLTVSYDISNNGETAYLPQINITSSNHMLFAKIPSNCRVDSNVVMLCDLNRGQPMVKGSRDAITVIFDVGSITGTEMVLKAEVFSTGRELNPLNNRAIDVITLREFTEVDAFGAPKTPHINLEEVSDRAEVINYYEIRSNGPSNVGGLEIVYNIPVGYRIPGSSTTIPIIDMNNITMQAVYDSQLVGIDFFENNTQIIMESYVYSSLSTERVSQIFEETTQSGSTHHIHPEHSLSDSVMTASMSRSRRRRETAAQTATKDQYSRIVQARAHDLLDEDLKGKLPVNRTIVFNCDDSELTVCVRAVMRVYNFKPERPLSVTMKFNVDLKEVNQLLIEPWEFYVIFIGLDIKKVGDFLGNSLVVKKKIEYNIISKHQLYGTPIWIIILAIIGGLLLLALITYGMYKAGFFKRTRKEEMAKLVHQNQGGVDGDAAETQNLNTESN